MRHKAIALIAAALAACAIAGGGDDNDTLNGTGDKSLWAVTISVSRTALTVQHGNTDTLTVTATRSGGFTGALEFEVDTFPGVSGAVTGSVTTGLTTTATVAITTGTTSDLVYSTPVGVRVFGASSSVHAETMITLNVTRKNGFWTTAPATMSIPRGTSSASTRVTFTKTGFTDDVTPSLAVPTGVTGITATFSPNPVVGDTVTNMTISVDAAVPESTYNLGVRMNGGGYQGTAPLSLTVTAAPVLTMNFATNPVTVARGNIGSSLINLGRTNLTAGITPVVTSGLPANVTASFGPPTSFGPTISMSISVGLTAVPGTYTVNVASGGAGVPVVTIPLTLTITP